MRHFHITPFIFAPKLAKIHTPLKVMTEAFIRMHIKFAFHRDGYGRGRC
jgi:hypothetical protein